MTLHLKHSYQKATFMLAGFISRESYPRVKLISLSMDDKGLLVMYDNICTKLSAGGMYTCKVCGIYICVFVGYCLAIKFL